MPKIFRAIGAMTGTSMDGVDLAFLETDGRQTLKFGPVASYPFSDGERAMLRSAVDAAKYLVGRDDRPGPLKPAEDLVTRRHIEAIHDFLARERVRSETVDLIGFHGQTVLHRPDRGLTVQIGDGAALARAVGIDVAYDLRAADMAAGGQGAPLVPVYHRALAEASGAVLPLLFVNIGGVANLTYVADGQDPIACDAGPGNALLDDLMRARTGAAMDADGACALSGKVDEGALDVLLANPFFAQKPPKSLDRNAFSAAPVAALSTPDAAATLAAFTARAILAHLPFLPEPPRMIVLCGGGARNPAIVRALGDHAPCAVRCAEDFGWASQAIEAQAFAFLAVRSVKGLPLTFPSTTGVREPVSGGALAWAGL
ncbi:anhydro-N-acetylmuramic acid kinase [Rhodoblastus acidophilus]|uniref:Anhydro-N-acetylmuramic acid kinase n=1 Tax=Candidatus Rhodoblastus alkanivorans TaxID=2954117 RepID=A0ABS9Z5Q6_9HYPH|nr:anhydro-N-acetylmuramic acid kinase [Candidatus Rhodoblastus alkanivorans]MCI4680095.1 anhydro-N-acetylmuramic acid kinase [Candidatus Rhodoblastus alkanivorans]MCI4682973.1 anhydro-N-acetylmuramic acid kinase [Candidatus Rhodoblastus alkanivorans]MDI4640283.1 anhydro-N-acetylmuramic acid kinase [Rhodoblastus acidophilus]